MLHESELASLAAISWHEPYLRFALSLHLQLFFILAQGFPYTFGDKGQPAPIWRPAWTGCIAYPHGEAPDFTPISGNRPD